MARRAVLSVADKSGIVDFAAELVACGWEVISTGGTARALRHGGVAAQEVSEVTGFQEILQGRVKTLHPAIHGGILARRDSSSDMGQLAANGIGPIDMVVCNLYPFVASASKPSVTIDEVIEEIDIGGVALLRAAAKNWAWVAVVCNPSRYAEVSRQIRLTGDVDKVTRRYLALEAFNHTSTYDSAIAAYLGGLWKGWPLNFPDELSLGYQKAYTLAQGENLHQKAALYQPIMGGWMFSAATSQVQGDMPTYNEVLDFDSAFRVVRDLPKRACVIAKHASPCGAAVARTAKEAFTKSLGADPGSCQGGVVVFNYGVDGGAASAMHDLHINALVAPSFTQEALEILKAKSETKVFALSSDPQSKGAAFGPQPRFTLRTAAGGLLVQENDSMVPKNEKWRVVSKRAPTDQEVKDLKFAMAVCKHAKSNAAVLAKDEATLAIGAGQSSGSRALRLAIGSGKDRVVGSCLALDGSFPLPGCIEAAAKAGVTAIVYPKGPVQGLLHATADFHGIAMVVTGTTHFMH